MTHANILSNSSDTSVKTTGSRRGNLPSNNRDRINKIKNAPIFLRALIYLLTPPLYHK